MLLRIGAVPGCYGSEPLEPEQPTDSWLPLPACLGRLVRGGVLQDAQKKATSVSEKKSVTMVVSGFQLAWTSANWLNVGYIKNWAETNLASWDVSVERRAGGYDSTISDNCPNLHTTNKSSLYALLATVVYQYQTTG